METCPHFGVCGGCSLQDLTPDAYRANKREVVVRALKRAGVEAEVLEPVSVPPRSRRRAVLKWKKGAIGFRAAKSHNIVDMRECLVLTPGIFDLAQNLRGRLAFLNAPCEVHVTESLTGFDLGFRSPQKASPVLTMKMARAVEGHSVARIIFNGSLLLETAAPEVQIGGIRLKLPPKAFLQSTMEGEAALQERVLGIVGKAKTVVDLFAGCGTFALVLAKKARVHAVEEDQGALKALVQAAKSTGLKPVTTEARDLFRQPLTALELAPYDAVVLDPPRAGAEAQVRMLAKSKVPVIAYVSCDAASFARDAALLCRGGYKIEPVTPIDQFLWSSHIELVAGFVRTR